jgi:hypothetical protein
LETSRSSRVGVGVGVAFTDGFLPRWGCSERSTPTGKVFYLQYFAYWPLQTWLLFRKPSAKRTL